MITQLEELNAGNIASNITNERNEKRNRNIQSMPEQQPPIFGQNKNDSDLARYSEYRPGEQAWYIDLRGRYVAGNVLHVSNRADGQIYLIESERGFPDVVFASEIIEKPS